MTDRCLECIDLPEQCDECERRMDAARLRATKVIAILHGDDIVVDARPGDSLADLRTRALAACKWPSSRPVEEWEIRDERGVYLDPKALVRDTPMAYPSWGQSRLFLTLPVGVGA